MGLQRGEHDLATKQQQQFIYIYIYMEREKQRKFLRGGHSPT